MSKDFKVTAAKPAGTGWRIEYKGNAFAHADSLREALAEINAAITLAEDGRYDLPAPAKAELSISILNSDDSARIISRAIDEAVRSTLRRASRSGYLV